MDRESLVFCLDLQKFGYHTEANLLVQPERGRYVVTLDRIISPGVYEGREVAWEPAEPDRQRQGVEWALRDPAAAVLDAAKIDRVREEARNAGL